MLEFVLVINLCLEVISIVGEIIDRDDVYWILSLIYIIFINYFFYYVDCFWV